MMQYYDERAKEYDLIYSGKGPASLKEDLYLRDVEKIFSIVQRYGAGRIIDKIFIR